MLPPKEERPPGLICSTLDTVDPKPTRWLVPEYVARGTLHLWAGDGGHGKSSGRDTFMACLSRGWPCFGMDYEPPEPCDVMMIQSEDGWANTVRPRLEAAGADCRRIVRVDGVPLSSGKQGTFNCCPDNL